MKRLLIYSLSIVVFGLSACNSGKSEQVKVEKSQSLKTNNMSNLISIVEIPTTDFSRAVKFYQTILDLAIEEIDMDGTQMGVLPSDGENVNVVLVKGNDYKPTTDGAVLYLNAGNDLQPMLDKVSQNVRQVIVPKTAISSEMGYFALFIDTEGNKLGLHSIQ